MICLICLHNLLPSLLNREYLNTLPTSPTHRIYKKHLKNVEKKRTKTARKSVRLLEKGIFRRAKDARLAIKSQLCPFFLDWKEGGEREKKQKRLLFFLFSLLRSRLGLLRRRLLFLLLLAFFLRRLFLLVLISRRAALGARAGGGDAGALPRPLRRRLLLLGRGPGFGLGLFGGGRGGLFAAVGFRLFLFLVLFFILLLLRFLFFFRRLALVVVAAVFLHLGVLLRVGFGGRGALGGLVLGPRFVFVAAAALFVLFGDLAGL